MVNLFGNNLFGINLFGSNVKDAQGSSRGQGSTNPLMLMSLMSLFGGGSRGCDGMDGSMRGGHQSNNIFGGRHHNSSQQMDYGQYGGYGQDYGNNDGGGYNSYGQDYGQDYGRESGRSNGRGYSNYNRNENSGGNFLMDLFTGVGLGVFASAIVSAISGPKNNENVKNVGNVDQKPFVNNPNASDKYAQFSDWESRIVKGEDCPNLEIANSKYTELMDAYHAGGDKDKTKLAEAKALYANNLTTMAKDEIKPYDKNGDGTLNYKEFIAKSVSEAQKDFELIKSGDPTMANKQFNLDEAMQAGENAFKNMSHDGVSVTEKDFVSMYSIADMVSKGHDGLCKGNIDCAGYESVGLKLGSSDVIKDETGTETKNDIADQIKGAYNLFFPAEVK